jgi:hypothetical protein
VTVEEPQDSVRARRHPQPSEQTSPRLGPDGKTDLDLRRSEPVSPPRMGSHEVWEGLAERLAGARGVLAAEPADPQPKAYGAVADGEVRWESDVGTVDTARALPALRTASASSRGVSRDEKPGLHRLYEVESAAGNRKGDDGRRHGKRRLVSLLERTLRYFTLSGSHKVRKSPKRVHSRGGSAGGLSLLIDNDYHPRVQVGVIEPLSARQADGRANGGLARYVAAMFLIRQGVSVSAAGR